MAVARGRATRMPPSSACPRCGWLLRLERGLEKLIDPFGEAHLARQRHMEEGDLADVVRYGPVKRGAGWKEKYIAWLEPPARAGRILEDDRALEDVDDLIRAVIPVEPAGGAVPHVSGASIVGAADEKLASRGGIPFENPFARDGIRLQSVGILVGSGSGCRGFAQVGLLMLPGPHRAAGIIR